MDTKKSFGLGLGIALIGGFIVYQVFTPSDASTDTRSPQVVGTNNNGAPAPTAKAPSSNLAPDFNLTSLEGKKIALSDYRGDKPVVLDFFASWCHNCQRSMPGLSRMYEKYQGQVEVIGVNLRESQSTAQSFIDSRGITFPVVLDSSGSTSNAYGVRYTNTHVLIDRDGNLVRTVPGDLRESDIVALINS